MVNLKTLLDTAAAHSQRSIIPSGEWMLFFTPPAPKRMGFLIIKFVY